MAVSAQDISSDLGLNAAQLGVLSGAFFYAFAGMQIPLGPLLDRIGGRRILIVFGSVSICGSLIFCFATDYHIALAARILLGIGSASVLMSSLKIFTNWYSQMEFTTISGMLVAVGSVGNLAATGPLAQAISRFGWRGCFIFVTILQVFTIMAVYLFVHDNPSDKQKVPETNRNPVDSDATTFTQAWRTIVSTPKFWLIALLAYFWYANYMVLQGLWGGPYLKDSVGLNSAQTGTVLLFSSIGYISSSLLLGKIIKLLGGLKKTILTGQGLLLVAMTLMLGPAENISFSVLLFCFFSIGFVSSSGLIVYPLVRELVPHKFAATAMTCVNFFLFFGTATMQHIIGSIIKIYPKTVSGYPADAYHRAFLIPICGLAITILLNMFAGNTKQTS